MNINDRLIDVINKYRREARKCEKAHAYLSASIMQAAALEASLQAMCFLYPADIKKTPVYQRKRFKSRRYKAFDFSFSQLINIAGEADWFPNKIITLGRKQTTMRELAHEVRNIRNLVHPGKWARELKSTEKVNRKLYESVYEICDVATSSLLERIYKSMRNRMKLDRLI
jgi:hypothetical protein